jgi:hypothetical protein
MGGCWQADQFSEDVFLSRRSWQRFSPSLLGIGIWERGTRGQACSSRSLACWGFSLRVRILPRRARGSQHLLGADDLDPSTEVLAVNKVRARRRSAQGGEMLAEGEILECELGASAEGGMQRFKKAHEQGGHGRIMHEG